MTDQTSTHTTDQTTDQTAAPAAPVPADQTKADQTTPQTGGSGNRKSRRAAASKSKGKTGAAAKAAAAKSKGKGKAADKPKRQHDAFGFVVGSDRSKVAAMYARPTGATAADINAAFGRDMPKLNLLRDAQTRGHGVGKLTVRDKATGRAVTCYRLTAAPKLTKGKPAPVPNRKPADTGTKGKADTTAAKAAQTAA